VRIQNFKSVKLGSYFSVGNTQETLVKNVEKHHAHHRHHDKKEKHYNNENKNAQF